MANYKVVDADQLDADLASVADSIRAKAGTTDQMAFPDGFKSNLEGLNIDLMETYVVSGPEEQVIYPDEGYYGFSKITVGAVDTSSGDIIQLPNADDSYFGDEEGEITVTSGYYYGGIDWIILPPIPDGYAKTFPYAVVYYNNVGSLGNTTPEYRLILSSTPIIMSFNSNTNGGFFYMLGSSNMTYDYLRFVYDEETGAWGSREPHVANGTVDDIDSYDGLVEDVWANHTVYKKNYSGVIMVSPTDPVPATTENKVVITVESADETYIISGTIVSSLTAAAQKVGGSSAAMTPGQAVDTLDEYYANPAEGMKF